MKHASSKLPCPTRSLPPRGGRSLLEDRAFPATTLYPVPHAWTRPDFLLPSTKWAAGRSWCCDPHLPDPFRGLSRRFNSRCSRAQTQLGRRGTGRHFAVVVPEYRVRWNRTTGVGLLATPIVLDLCKGDSDTGYVVKCVHCLRTRFLSSLLASPTLVEEGGSALPRAEGSSGVPFLKRERSEWSGGEEHPTRLGNDTTIFNCP